MISPIAERLWIATISCLFVTGCTVTSVDLTSIPYVPGIEEAPEFYAPQEVSEYRIQIGDTLTIRSYYDPQLDQTVKVRPDGRISVLLIDELFVVGMTPSALDENITKAYTPLVASPEVTVILQESVGNSIYVGGEVRSPDVQVLHGPLTTLQAVASAGGFLDTAALQNVILMRKQTDGQFSIYKIDYSKVLSNQAREIYLWPSDIIYVPRSKIANINLFIDQYINKVIPRSVLFTYQVTRVKNNSGSSIILTP